MVFQPNHNMFLQPVPPMPADLKQSPKKNFISLLQKASSFSTVISTQA